MDISKVKNATLAVGFTLYTSTSWRDFWFAVSAIEAACFADEVIGRK